MRSHITIPLTFIAAALLLTGCGGTAVSPTPPVTVTPIATDEAASTGPNEAMDKNKAEDMADEMVENLEKQQSAEGGGKATFTAGDETWEFDSALCAFGEAEIGQKDAVFNLSSIQDGLQLYISIDAQGHSMSLEDVKDFDNPSVSLAQADALVDFLVLKGKDVSGEATVLDWTEQPPTRIPAKVEATCP